MCIDRGALFCNGGVLGGRGRERERERGEAGALESGKKERCKGGGVGKGREGEEGERG